MTDHQELKHLDASTFQRPLEQLAEVLAQKLKREAPKLIPAPNYVAVDLHVLLRQAIYTYNLLFYLNADERRETDPYWRPAYSIVTLPLIRNIIDCLYNITAILEDPGKNGPWFRKSGFCKALAALDEDEKRYGGQQIWDEWIKKGRDLIYYQMRVNGISLSDVSVAMQWPTMGTYINRLQSGGTTNLHQDFLKIFTYGNWREYSAMAHGSFEGLMKLGLYFVVDSMPHDDRPKVEQEHLKVLFLHIGRAAGTLLCIVTELQAYFKFDGANINERIHKMWDALMPVFEIQELYDQRYSQLMKDKGI
ncbi:MAG TPA: hypothetical protein VGK24_01265 [Candidatus Angelobacter sp.]|jgi:hypothetical protein